jgi:uncharacterized RDD family membrane protein YckC
MAAGQVKALSIAGRPPATVAQRLAGGLVDALVLGALALVWYGNGRWQINGLDALSAVAILAYKPLCEGAGGASLGKLCTRIRVRSWTGPPLTWRAAWLRNLPVLVLIGLEFAETAILDGILVGGYRTSLRVVGGAVWSEAEFAAIRAAEEQAEVVRCIFLPVGAAALAFIAATLGRTRHDPHRRAPWDRLAGTVCVRA